MFHVGQKVACVDGAPEANAKKWGRGSALVEGQIYTVSKIGMAVGSIPGIKLVEIVLSGLSDGRPFYDNFYRASRFRPVVEKKTDIAVFTEMLAPKELING